MSGIIYESQSTLFTLLITLAEPLGEVGS